MPRATPFILTTLSLLIALPTVAAAGPTIEERMTAEERAASGLDMLSPEQLKFLNEWVATRGVSASVAPLRKKDGSMTFYTDDADRSIVTSRIVGTFGGWSGKTSVTLENGQKWQQVESTTRGARLTAPEVTIKPMSMGSWLMMVKNCNCSVRVKRVG